MVCRKFPQERAVQKTCILHLAGQNVTVEALLLQSRGCKSSKSRKWLQKRSGSVASFIIILRCAKKTCSRNIPALQSAKNPYVRAHRPWPLAQGPLPVTAVFLKRSKRPVGDTHQKKATQKKLHNSLSQMCFRCRSTAFPTPRLHVKQVAQLATEAH